MTLGRLSPFDIILIWESYCPFEMLNKSEGCWYNSERKWESQKQNKMLCNGMHLKKTKYFNQYLNSSSVGQDLLISSLTTDTTTKRHSTDLYRH